VARAKANGIEIEYETTGNKRDPALLLVMGLGAQFQSYPGWGHDFPGKLILTIADRIATFCKGAS
jgi:hypothetical protein